MLVKVDAALRAQARSGIHRVIVEIARALPAHADTHLVCWDPLAGHIRPIDRLEFNRLFDPGEWPAGLAPNPAARRVGYRFDDLIPCPRETWLLSPEVPIHETEGVEILARTITQCREYGVRTASIFYDLIPATNPAYASDKPAFLSYLCEIARSDLVLPISHYSAEVLRTFWGKTAASLSDIDVVPLPLAEAPPHVALKTPDPEADKSLIVLLGVVEPRKRQVEFLQAYAAARQHSPALAKLEVCIVGALHPAVAKPFEKLVQRTPGVRYLRHLPDDQIAELMRRAAFSAFVSDDEGFGLPITESLAAGVPCLCADFGAMAEVAAGGGCLTVDVRDPAALQAALRRLAEDLALRAKLRAEIADRPPRPWSDYALQLVGALLGAKAAANDVPPAVVERVEPGALSRSELDRLARADVVTARSDEDYDRFVVAAEAADIDVLLPSRRAIGGAPDAARQAAEAAAQLDGQRRRRADIARIERRYADARRALRTQTAPRPIFLRIVISTYNRLPFVVENVAWLLKALRDHQDVELVVVDNASTDGTVEALERAHGARLKLRINPTNVGMLGNLRVCSQMTGAEYVWVVGDDDFIVPGQLENVVAGLKANLGVPIAAVNFAVYHRETLGPADHPAVLSAKPTPLAPDAIASGRYPVSTVAAQHDNLFTAIYGIIWRQDVLAACYDYPFSGRPFSTLVESIPCTKLILESYAACDAYWGQPVAIVGNAHNSWTQHRPRWHGRLMAEAIALARDAGVDPAQLLPWARQQADLYEEAFAIARQNGTPLAMDEPEAFDPSWPLFRRRLSGSAGS